MLEAREWLQFLEHVLHVKVHVRVLVHCCVHQLGHYFRPQLLKGAQLVVGDEGRGEKGVTEGVGSADSVLLGHTHRLLLRGEVMETHTTDWLRTSVAAQERENHV